MKTSDKRFRASFIADDETYTKHREALIAKDTRPPTAGDRFPTSRAGLIVTDEDREFVSQIVMEVVEAGKMPKVKDDDDLEQRLEDYYVRCGTRGILPTIEEMELYTGYSHGWWQDVLSGRCRGFSPRTSTILKKAKTHAQSIDAKLVESGKLNFLTYCFRAKNYYGMTDKTEVTIAPKAADVTEIDPEEIRRKYLSACNPIPTEYAD